MSTKIYNAYKWNGNIYSLLEFLQELKPKVWQHKLDFLKNYTGSFDEVLEEMKKVMWVGLNNPLNVSSSAVVYFYKRKIFVQFFDVHHSFLEDERLQDFHYQNQVDMPDNVTNRHWNYRCKVWDAIFKTGVPSEDGLTFGIIDYDDIWRFCRELKN